jgi:hypothetical protein
MKEKSEYSKKLLDPRWQKKRLETLSRYNWTCQICGSKERTLHVHHRRYLPGKDPWDVPDELLVALCYICHEGEQEMEAAIYDLVAMVKEKFFSHEVQRLSNAFHSLNTEQISEIFSSSLEHWFSKPELVSEIMSRYFEYLNNKNSYPTNGDL